MKNFTLCTPESSLAVAVAVNPPMIMTLLPNGIVLPKMVIPAVGAVVSLEQFEIRYI
jgi:hypothetical protein